MVESVGSIFSDSEKRFLSALVKHKVMFMIVGLSAAALQGSAVVTQDIDLWVKDLTSSEFLVALESVNATYVPPSMLNPPTIAGDGFQLFDLVLSMTGLGDFDSEYSQVRWMQVENIKVPVLPLARIIESKRAAGRDKDKLTVPILEDTLRVLSIWPDEE